MFKWVGKRFVNALNWKKKIPVTEWARKYHNLPETAAVKGKWGEHVAVPFADMFISWHNKKNLQEIGYFAASQISKTESILVLINYSIDRDPSAMTLFFPNDNLAQFNATEKVIPAIRSCKVNSESIDRKLSEINRKEKTLIIRYLGGFLKIAGAETPRNRKSINSKITFIDEASEIDLPAIAEIAERSKTYANYGRKLYLTSTMVNDDVDESGLSKDPIYRFYETAECAVHWEAKCPYCNKYSELDIEQVEYPAKPKNFSEAAYYSYAARNAAYVCPHCKAKWNDRDRYDAIENGRKKILRGDEDTAYSICLRVNSLYSVFLPLSLIVQKKLEAEGNPELEQKFYHGWLAKRYERKYDRMDYEKIFAIESTIEKSRAPEDTIALTLTVDVQKDHFWIMIVAHTPRSIHIVDWSRVESWLHIENIMYKIYVDQNGKEIPIDLTAVDYGYSQDGTVTEFAQDHRGELILMKGSGNSQAKLFTTSTIETDASGKNIPGGLQLYVTNTSHYKSVLWAKMQRKIERDASENIVTIPKVEYLDDGQPRADFIELAKQLTAENYYTEASKSPNGKTGWQKVSKHVDNHYFDCLYMQVALSDIMGLRYRPKEERREERGGDNQPPPSVLDVY